MSDVALTSADTSADGEAMTEDELASLLAAMERQAVGYMNSEIAADQELALNYYNGRRFGDEMDGRSQVVDRTVAITVDNAIAALLKPFVSTDESVVFEPVGPEDEDAAKQATEYVNYVFHVDNPGFQILHDWFKDASLSKLGVVKTWWNDTSCTKRVPVTLEAQQLEQAMSDPEYKVVDGPFETEDPNLFLVHVDEEYADGSVKVENVPPEEFRISPFARNMESASYIAHVTQKTRSELIEMGFDRDAVMSLAKFAYDPQKDSRSQARYQDESQGGTTGGMMVDRSQELVEVAHEFPLVDFNNDGKSERREIIRSGTVILYNEETDAHPFAGLCPVPMPHKVYGLSFADLTADLQRIRSVIWRQSLDNLYLSNNPRPVLPEQAERDDGSTLDDLEDVSPGAIIRVRQPNMLDTFSVEFVADKSFPMLELTEQQLTARTGVSMVGQGLDKNTLKKEQTATEAAIQDNGRNARIDMVARIFAETGVKALFKRILALVVQHQPRERVIRLRNQWVPIDPRSWNAEMDVSISVGLGVGNRQERVGNAMQALQVTQELALSPYAEMVPAEKVYNQVKELFTALGWKNTDNYLLEPKEQVGPDGQPLPKPEKPDPEMMKVQAQAQNDQAKLQLEQQKAAAEISATQQKNAATIEAQREKASLDLQLAREKAQAELDLAREQQAAELQLAREKMQMDYDLALQTAQLNAKAKVDAATAEPALPSYRPGGDLDK